MSAAEEAVLVLVLDALGNLLPSAHAPTRNNVKVACRKPGCFAAEVTILELPGSGGPTAHEIRLTTLGLRQESGLLCAWNARTWCKG